MKAEREALRDEVEWIDKRLAELERENDEEGGDDADEDEHQ